jgi:hypothetical protein
MDALDSIPLLLDTHSIALDALDIFIPGGSQPREPTKDPGLIMKNLLAVTSEALTTLSISGLPGNACAVTHIWTSYAQVSRPRLSTLRLDRILWQKLEWEELTTQLSDDIHPLTRSQETICIRDSTGQLDCPKLFAILEMNQSLTKVDLEVSIMGVPLIECHRRAEIQLKFISASTRRREGPLSLRQKLALLSVFARSPELSWDYESIMRVFEFAAPTVLRRVALSMPVVRESAGSAGPSSPCNCDDVIQEREKVLEQREITARNHVKRSRGRIVDANNENNTEMKLPVLRFLNCDPEWFLGRFVDDCLRNSNSRPSTTTLPQLLIQQRTAAYHINRVCLVEQTARSAKSHSGCVTCERSAGGDAKGYGLIH